MTSLQYKIDLSDNHITMGTNENDLKYPTSTDLFLTYAKELDSRFKSVGFYSIYNEQNGFFESFNIREIEVISAYGFCSLVISFEDIDEKYIIMVKFSCGENFVVVNGVYYRSPNSYERKFGRMNIEPLCSTNELTFFTTKVDLIEKQLKEENGLIAVEKQPTQVKQPIIIEQESNDEKREEDSIAKYFWGF